MYAKLLGFLLFACQVILNGSHVIRETTEDAISVTSTLAPAPSTLPKGYVRFPDLHVAYKVYKKSIPWGRARDRCIARGAHLAIADTVQKIERIYAMQSEVNNWISVGIHRSRTSNGWVRIDNNLPLTSLPWRENGLDDQENCVAIAFTGNSLVTSNCRTDPNWYVCEIPI